jgi:hypothetical protein
MWALFLSGLTNLAAVAAIPATAIVGLGLLLRSRSQRPPAADAQQVSVLIREAVLAAEHNYQHAAPGEETDRQKLAFALDLLLDRLRQAGLHLDRQDASARLEVALRMFRLDAQGRAPHRHSRADLDLGELQQTLVVGLAAPVTDLNLGEAGSVVPLDGTLMVNTIPGASFHSATKQVTLPAGSYLMTFSYEVGATQASAHPTWSSYFVDFPNRRQHSTATHNPGGTSNHGGTMTSTVVLGDPTTVGFHMGRGQSGNYTGPIELTRAQLAILRLGEPSTMT